MLPPAFFAAAFSMPIRYFTIRYASPDARIIFFMRQLMR